MKKPVRLLFLIVALVFSAVIAERVPVVAADGPIYIRADGSVEGTDRIQRDGDVYTFIGDIDVINAYTHIGAGLWVEKDNIVVDGAGFALQTNVGVSIGVNLAARNNVTIKNMRIVGFNHGFNLADSSDNTILGNSLDGSGVEGYPAGLWVWNSSNNNINDNTITGYEEFGILFQMSSNNMLTGNVLTSNNIGLKLDYSPNNILRNNQINGNNENFGVGYNSLADFIQDIDTSNTVDGKPIYYWINEHDRIVPSDAGFVALGNCTNITVQNLKVTNNYDSIMLYFTNNSIVAGNDISGCANGIALRSCHNISVSENKLANNRYLGVSTEASANISITKNDISTSGTGITSSGKTPARGGSSGSTQTLISENSITGNSPGIDFTYSDGNIITNNYVANNIYTGMNFVFSYNNQVIGNTLLENNGSGIRISGAENNIFYHNKFIGNEVTEGLQVSNPWYWGHSEPNSWDNGAEGNYWSDYLLRYPNATEVDNSGTGDTPYFINEVNIDHYPLMTSRETDLPSDTTSPTISLLSPENKTYTTNNVSLSFIVNEAPSWMGYSLDSQDAVTIEGNTTLTALPCGEHSLKVYATDASGNTGTSATTYFTITDSETQPEPEPFPTTTIIAAAASVTIISAGFLIYYLKFMKKR